MTVYCFRFIEKNEGNLFTYLCKENLFMNDIFTIYYFDIFTSFTKC